MKSIEEKAKAYDEALKVLHKYYGANIMFTQDMEDMFPELKESEDERIRKELLQIANENDDSFYMVMTPNKRKRLIAWLEKQGEHAKFRDSIQVGDKVTRNQDGVLVNQSQLKRVAKKDEKQGEQKQELLTKEKALKNSPFVEQKSADKVEPKFKVGDIIKPKCYNETHSIKAMGERYYILDVDIKIPFRNEDEWELVEHKNAWSEEDELMLMSIIQTLKLTNGAAQLKIDWLKSLKGRAKPQSTWKPSEEQIEALNRAMYHVEDDVATQIAKLIGDLKKLRDK